MAGRTGFEPANFAVTGRRVNRATPPAPQDATRLNVATWYYSTTKRATGLGSFFFFWWRDVDLNFWLRL